MFAKVTAIHHLCGRARVTCLCRPDLECSLSEMACDWLRSGIGVELAHSETFFKVVKEVLPNDSRNELMHIPTIAF